MKRRFGLSVFLLIILIPCIFPWLAACIPDIPMPMAEEQQPNAADETIDDLGCFPIDCDMPPGMKELCEAYRSGTINWPGNCAEMPGEACQALCEREKEDLGLDLPEIVVDAYQVGWTKPVQFDDHIDDSVRIKHGWAWPKMHIENDGLVRFWYAVNTSLDKYPPTYTRTWDGSQFSEPEKFPYDLVVSTYDNQGRLHGIEIKDRGSEKERMNYVIWDGNNAVEEIIFAGQFFQPGPAGLEMDEEGNLHLIFSDISKGVREVWYARFDGADWTSSVNLSHSIYDSWGLSISVGPGGKLYAAWHEVPPDIAPPGLGGYTMMAVFDGQSWSEPEKVPLDRTWVSVKTDSAGKVHLMSEGKYICWDGEKWENPVNVDYPGYGTAFYHWTIDPYDNVHIVWNRLITVPDAVDEEERIRREFFYRIRYADGSWSPVITFGLWGTSASFEEVHSTILSDENGVIHIAMAGNFDGLNKHYYLNSGGTIQDASLLELETLPPQPVRRKSTFPEPEMMALSGISGWNPVESVPAVGTSHDRIDFDSALSSNGNIHLLWTNWVDDDTEIFYSQYDGASWGSAKNISNSGEYDFQPRISVDGENRIHAAWVHAVPGTPTIYYSQFSDGVWSSPERLSRPISWTLPTYSPEEIGMTVENEEEVVNPAISASQAGEVAVGFEQRSIGMANLTSFTINSGDGWTSSEIIAKDHDPWWYSVSWLNLDYDKNNILHALSAYSGYINPTVWLYAQPMYMRFDGSSWSEPKLLMSLPSQEENTPGAQMAFLPALEAVDDDSVFAVFSLRRTEREYLPYVWENENSYVHLMHWDGSTWGDPLRVDNSTAFGPSAADMAVDSQGIAHIVWSKYDAHSSTYSIFYTTSDCQTIGEVYRLWQSAENFEPMLLIRPQILIDHEENLHVFFTYQENGAWKIGSTSKASK